MIYATEIVRLDGESLTPHHRSILRADTSLPGLFLVATMDDQAQKDVQELKQQVRQVLKKMTPNAAPRASIESKTCTMQ